MVRIDYLLFIDFCKSLRTAKHEISQKNCKGRSKRCTDEEGDTLEKEPRNLIVVPYSKKQGREIVGKNEKILPDCKGDICKRRATYILLDRDIRRVSNEPAPFATL